jgi:beta-glucosidase
MFLDPILRGRYADDLAADTEGMLFEGRPWQDHVRDGDLALISTPLDVLGVNYYHGDAPAGRPVPDADLLGSRIRHPKRHTSIPWPGCEHVSFPRRGLPVTGMDWEVQPEGLTRLLVRLKEEYDVPPLYITENGAAYDDVIAADGTIDDPGRLGFIDAHLRATYDAMQQGVDVRGYFAWSLLDNYEWAYGYAQRFGIVHVDYETQARTPKASARYYAQVAASGTLPGLSGVSG